MPPQLLGGKGGRATSSDTSLPTDLRAPAGLAPHSIAGMGTRVIVGVRSKTFLRGLEIALSERGLLAEPEPQETDWWLDRDCREIVYVMDVGGGAAPHRSSRILRAVRTVALLKDDALDSFLSALREGAIGVVEADAEPDRIAAVIAAAAGGLTLLPSPVVQDLVSHAVWPAGRIHLSEREVEWLRQLAAGVPVRVLAEASGLPVRTLHRRLESVYERLDAANRVQAIAVAARLGLLEQA